MKYDKVTIVGVALCVVLLVFWNPILGSLGLHRAVAPPAGQAEPSGPGESAPADVGPELPDATDPAQAPEPTAPEPARNEPRPRAVGERQAWDPPRQPPVTLAVGEALAAEIDPGGGGVTRVLLQQYARDVVRDPGLREAVALGRAEYPFLALDLRRAGLRPGPAVVVESSALALEIQRETATGLVLAERWQASPETPYQIRYTVRFRNPTADSLRLEGLAIEAGAMPPNVSARPSASRSVFSSVVIALAGQARPKTYTSKQLSKLASKGRQHDTEAQPTKWVAVQSQYFMLAVIAGTVADDTLFVGTEVDLRPVVLPGVGGKDIAQVWCQARGLLAPRSLAPGSESVFTVTGLATPKDYGLLRQVGGRTETVVGMDSFMFWNPAWMGLLTRWLLDTLIWLNRLFRVPWGYGLAIIVITFAVKILFWPLTHYSTTSMRRMQALQPQLKELREKHKDDPQKLYRKQAELFKENHVNQFGGCLPVLLQLPVFFALFVTFRGAIELRHASFLWSADLSQPDDVFGLPIRPLAILMGATMYLQQRLTPSAGDPQQQRMMNFMSIFFIFLFYGMPSGLTLYWTVSQILSIVQMLVTEAIHRRSAHGKAAAQTS
jgi:YidC/Oxa1 family membrane protein insertase